MGKERGKDIPERLEMVQVYHLLGKSEPLCRAGESWEDSRNLWGEAREGA